jgi:hypothetical protein
MRRVEIGRVAVRASILASAVLALPLASQAAAPKPPSPVVNPGYADQLTVSSAALHGSISPGGAGVSYFFEYGHTQGYGAQTPTLPLERGTQTIHVSAAITGLSVNSTYHFRLVAVGPGAVVHGADRSFKTPKIPLTLTITAAPNPTTFGSPVAVSGTLSGTESPNHQVALQATPFPYLSGFKYISNPQLTNASGGFSFSLANISRNMQLRVVTIGAPVVQSSVLSELVMVRASLHARPTARRRFVRFYGVVAPSEVGVHVTFQWLKPGGGPINLGGAITRKGNPNFARFSRVLHVRHRGLYRVFVHVTNGKQISGYSRAIIVR